MGVMDAQVAENPERRQSDLRRPRRIAFPVMTLVAALFIMTSVACGDEEAFALHIHGGDSKDGHPSIPPLDYNGNQYDLYLELETRQLVFFINMETDNLDPSKSYVISFVNGDSTYVYLGDYDYTTSPDGNWTKYTLSLTSDNVRKIEQLFTSKDATSSLKFGLAPGAVFYYDKNYGYIDNRNVQHSLVLVDVLDRKPRFLLDGISAIELEQGDTYSNTDITCIDNDDLNPILGHNASTAHAGHFVVEHTCTDSSGNEATPVYSTLYVTSIDKPPAVVTPTESLQVVEGSELLYHITSDSPDVEFSLVSHNASHRAGPEPIVNVTGWLSWTPSESQGGHGDVYRITVEAINMNGTSSSIADIFVDVAESNSAPTLSPFEPLNVPHGAEISINVSSNAADSDVPRNKLVYSIVSGAGSINADTGVFTWTPHKSDAGTYLVNFTVSDGLDKAAGTQSITVRDVTPPIIQAMPDIEAHVDSSPSTAPPEARYQLPTAVDLVDGPVSVTCAPASGTLLTQIVTTVTCNAHDAAGNTAEPVTFNVVVPPDSEAPTIIPSVVWAVEAAGSLTSVLVPPPAVSDNRDAVADIIIQTNVTGSFKTVAELLWHEFELGEHVVHWRATDTSGNMAVASQTITVRDTTPPHISPTQDVRVQGILPANVSYTVPTAVDVVDGAVQVTCTPPPGHEFTLPSTVVSCNAHDAAGNHAKPVSFNVVVTQTLSTSNMYTVQSSDLGESTAEMVDDLDAERKTLQKIFKKLQKDIKGLQASVSEAFDNIAGTDKVYAKQQKKIAFLEKALDETRTEKKLKKDLLEFYVNPEHVFRNHGVDDRTGNHVLVFLSGNNATGCNYDTTINGAPCLSSSIYIGHNNSRLMVLGDIRNLEFWPNRTIYAGDTFEWTYPADVQMRTVTITKPDGSNTTASPGSYNTPSEGTFQSHTFDTPGVFNWSVDGHISTRGTVTVIEAPALRSLLEDTESGTNGAQVLSQSGIAILERKIAIWNEKIDVLQDEKKNLKMTLKSAKNGDLGLDDLHQMGRAEIKDLSKATKHVKKKINMFDDILVYYTQPGHVFSDHGRDEGTDNHVIELSQECGGDGNDKSCLSTDVLEQLGDEKRPTLTRISHLNFWPDRTIWSGETVEWRYHEVDKEQVARIQGDALTANGTKLMTLPGGTGGNSTSQIYTFTEPGKYTWLLYDNPNVNGTIYVTRAVK